MMTIVTLLPLSMLLLSLYELPLSMLLQAKHPLVAMRRAPAVPLVGLQALPGKHPAPMLPPAHSPMSPTWCPLTCAPLVSAVEVAVVLCTIAEHWCYDVQLVSIDCL